jgi:pimeloyl-ACP methyl ester carboxylesterase
LAQRFTVYAIDLPGFGSMRHYRRDFALSRAPEWIHAFLDALDLGSVVLVGHSMGGLIALSAAARWPGRVRKLVLAAAAIGLPRRTPMSYLMPLMTAARYGSVRFAPTLLQDAVRAGPLTLWHAAHELLDTDVRHQIEAVRAETLLIWGERDALVPPSIAEVLHNAIAGSELRVIRGAGHVVMFDRPMEFNSTLLEFLSRGGPEP